MKKRFLGVLLSLSMVLMVFPALAYADSEKPSEESICICETACEADDMNTDCPVCGAEGASVRDCDRYVVKVSATAEESITLSVPFTTTVKQGGSVAPGKTSFTLQIADANAGEESYADVTVNGTVTTKGAGSYKGTLTLTGPFEQLRSMLCEGAFVKQVDGGEANWIYDDTVWGLLLVDDPVALSEDSIPSYSVEILPATYDKNGEYYELDYDSASVDQMRFTNTYTKSAAKPDKPSEPLDSTDNNPKADISDNAPQTGDNSLMGLWVALLLVSSCGVIGATVYTRKKRED